VVLELNRNILTKEIDAATIQLEKGDKVEILIDVVGGKVSYVVKAYLAKPNPGSDFDPAITRFRIVDGTLSLDEGSYRRVITASINANYAAEFRPLEDGDIRVEVVFRPLEMPGWIFRLFGRFYEEPKEALIQG